MTAETQGKRILLRGNLVGRRNRSPYAEVVHLPAAIKGGPADNAFVLVYQTGQARYVSWIGYFDIEYASRREPGAWEIVEPPSAFQREVDWFPFGWNGTEYLPSIGDLVLDIHDRLPLT